MKPAALQTAPRERGPRRRQAQHSAAGMAPRFPPPSRATPTERRSRRDMSRSNRRRSQRCRHHRSRQGHRPRPNQSTGSGCNPPRRRCRRPLRRTCTPRTLAFDDRPRRPLQTGTRHARRRMSSAVHKPCHRCTSTIPRRGNQTSRRRGSAQEDRSGCDRRDRPRAESSAQRNVFVVYDPHPSRGTRNVGAIERGIVAQHCDSHRPRLAPPAGFQSR
jgi:hypothetical protein